MTKSCHKIDAIILNMKQFHLAFDHVGGKKLSRGSPASVSECSSISYSNANAYSNASPNSNLSGSMYVFSQFIEISIYDCGFQRSLLAPEANMSAQQNTAFVVFSRLS